MILKNATTKNAFFFIFVCAIVKMNIYLQPLYSTGALAQLVEQRTENPCVPGSIPGGTTAKPRSYDRGFLFCTNDFIFF